MVNQLNYLEGVNGTKLTGKKDPFTGETIFTKTSAPMIGIDSQSGLTKYGPGTVLEGLNVTSAFGSNNLVLALDRYIEKMTKRGTKDGVYDELNLTPFQLEKLKKAKLEKQSYFDTAFEDEQERERQIEEAKFQANLNKEQKRQRQNDLDRIERAYREDTEGKAGSYAPGGGSGIQRDSKGNETGYNDPFDPGGGEKDGGHIDGTNRRKDYRYGGRASYFNGGIASFKNGGRINFKGGGMDASKSDFKSTNTKSPGHPSNRTTNPSTNKATSGGGGGGGGGGGPKPGSGRVNIPNKSGPKNLSFFDKINIHSANNAKFEKAYRDGLISSDEYNVLGGLSSKRDLGFGPVKTAAASTAYNLVQSALGPKFSRGNQPLFDGASDIGRNIFGSTLKPDSALAQTYDTIINTYKRGGRVNYFNGGIVSLRRR